MNICEKRELVEYYSHYITDSRFEKIYKHSHNRTRYATILLEDIQQTHNISAAVRSAEGFGIQDVHIVEQKFRYSLSNSVAKGAEDWLNLYRYNQKDAHKAFNNTQNCYEKLKKEGYKIYATTPHTQDVYIYDMPLNTKVALAFGTEHAGLSDYALEHADGFVKIPMHGFTESFNISVSVSICLYDITRRLRASDYRWQLSESEILDIQIEWLKRTIKP